jgi:hypothetical protein
MPGPENPPGSIRYLTSPPPAVSTTHLGVQPNLLPKLDLESLFEEVQSFSKERSMDTQQAPMTHHPG